MNFFFENIWRYKNYSLSLQWFVTVQVIVSLDNDCRDDDDYHEQTIVFVGGVDKFNTALFCMYINEIFSVVVNSGK